VTKNQSAGPISYLEHRATRVLHCAIVTRAAVLMFPLLLQTIISNQMRPRRLRGERGAEHNWVFFRLHGLHTAQIKEAIRHSVDALYANAVLIVFVYLEN